LRVAALLRCVAIDTVCDVRLCDSVALRLSEEQEEEDIVL
jgi:hypothetical protein